MYTDREAHCLEMVLGCLVTQIDFPRLAKEPETRTLCKIQPKRCIKPLKKLYRVTLRSQYHWWMEKGTEALSNTGRRRKKKVGQKHIVVVTLIWIQEWEFSSSLWSHAAGQAAPFSSPTVPWQLEASLLRRLPHRDEFLTAFTAVPAQTVAEQNAGSFLAVINLPISLVPCFWDGPAIT